MAIKTEKDMFGQLKYSIYRMGLTKYITLSRIETGMTAKGIPDIYLDSPWACAWIESKRYVHSGNSNMHIPFRPGQFKFIERHFKGPVRAILYTYYAKEEMLFLHYDVGIKEVYENIDNFFELSSFNAVERQFASGQLIRVLLGDAQAKEAFNEIGGVSV